MKQTILLLARFIKNIVFLGSLFVIVSIMVDWYRMPTIPEDFATQVHYDIEQQPKIIAQLSHSQPMLLYFWGDWCHFCEVTSPSIQKLNDNDIPILAIALKSGSDEKLKNYLAKNRYYFSTVNDFNSEISKQWNIQATPTILIIKDGKVISQTTGYTSYLGLKFRLWLANFAN